MRVPPIFFVTLLLLFAVLGGCREPRKAPVSSMRYEEGLSQRAWEMLDTGAPFEEVMRVQREAVRLLREGRSHENPVAVLEQMAYFLFSEGRLEDAYPFFTAAEDSLRRHPELAATESALMLYGDLSQFYDRLGMPEPAIAYSDSAMTVGRGIGSPLIVDIWRFRTQIYANRGQTAAAFACLDSADRAIRVYSEPRDIAYMHALVGGDRANIILSRNPSPDSLALAASMLRRAHDILKNEDYVGCLGPYGYALFMQGHREEGLLMMEQAVDNLRDAGDLEMSYLELRRLIGACTAADMFDRLGDLYGEYTLLEDSMSRARHNMDLVTARVREEVKVRQQDNIRLEQRLHTQRRRTTSLIIVLVLILLVALVAFILIFLRLNRIRRSRDKALLRIGEMRGEAVPQPDADILRNPRLAGNNAGPFVRSFGAMYPDFVPKLRETCPSLTDTDMTFCMLIYLKHSSDEIAVCLNISRASVNSARYRIRTKLRLPRNVRLDDYLRDIMPRKS